MFLVKQVRICFPTGGALLAKPPPEIVQWGDTAMKTNPVFAMLNRPQRVNVKPSLSGGGTFSSSGEGIYTFNEVHLLSGSVLEERSCAESAVQNGQ